MEPGLPRDCAVNTAVLSRREPAQHGETLSSLLLLIEKPIAIYLLTLDIDSVPRGAARTKPLLGSPSHLRCPSALSCSCGGGGDADAPQNAPARRNGKGTGGGQCVALALLGLAARTSFMGLWETFAPESWSLER